MSDTKSLRICIAIGALALAMGTSARAQGASAQEQQAQLPKAFGEPRSVNVAPAFGAVSDSIPIIVPPGRRNVEPHLALTYSSQGGLGNTGLGWQLDTGCVARWRGDGIPTVGDPDAFAYSLAGAAGELHDAGGGVYRARLESIYREFHRLGNQPDDGWEMSNGEGVLHRFGGTAESRIEDSGGRGRLWLLDLVQDRSGNTITYSYERVDNTLYPKEIRYTGFAPTGDLGANRIVFEYEGRPDKRVSYNNTVREERTRRLRRISVFAGESLTRRYELAYEQSPMNEQSLLRRVKLVDAADASRITLRTLEYGSRALGWNSGPLVGTIPVDLADEDSKATGARIIDVDGDGFADVVGNGVGVWLGNGQGGFYGDETDPWNTSLASAGVQFVEPSGDHRGADKGVRLIDVNSDGLPDLFIAQTSRRQVWLNTGSGWSPDAQWTASLESLKPYAAVDPNYSLGPVDFSDEDILNLSLLVEQLQDDSYAVSQFLWDRFDPNTQQLISDFNEADPDHQELRDALVEDVNEVIHGDLIYEQERFSDVDLSDATETLLEQNPEGPWLRRLNRLLLEDAYPGAISKRYTPPIYGELEEEYSDEKFAIVEDDGVSKGVNLADVNGDGRIDILWSIDRSDVLYWGNQQIPIVLRAVFLNTGNGWVIDPSLTEELRYFPFVTDSQLPGYDVMDLNGDGLADIVRTFKDEQEAHLGTGRGWDEDLNTSASLKENQIVSLAEVDDERRGQGLMPLDFDDDGLVDYLQANEIVTKAWHNTGTGWEAAPEMAANLSALGIAFNSADGDATGVTVADVDGDGLCDLLRAKQGEEDRIWLSSSLRSGLLVRATSALGEVIEVEWMPSTSFDNKVGGLERLPFSMPVATKLTRRDGRGNAYETLYHYQGGLFEDRQSRGFRWSRQMRPGGLRVETWYHQEEGLAGMPDVEAGYDSQGELRTRRSSEYGTAVAVPGKVKQIRLIQTDLKAIDPGGTLHSSAIYAYDERLNIVSVSRDPNVDVDGDETVTLFSWARNDGAGIWSMPARTQTRDPDGSVLSESITLYDGLPEGQADRGLPSETKDLVEPGTYVSKLMEYDQYGNVLRIRNRNGHDTTFEYGEPTATFRTRAVDPEGRVVESGYHPGFGALLWDKDASGNVTYKTYDAFGRLVRVILPGDEQSPFGTESYTYSPLGDADAQFYRVAQTETPGQPDVFETTYSFDGMGLIYRVEQEGPDGRNPVTATEFDDAGNAVAISRPFLQGDLPLMSIIKRDELHRPLRVVEPDGIELTMAYAGRRVDVVDRRGSKTSFYRNVDGQVTEIHQWVEGAEQVTRYRYDLLGRLTTTVDALGEVTRIAYDALGRRVSLEDPGAGTYAYRYDAEGNLVEQTAPDGQTTRFRYNQAGDLTRKEFPDGTAQEFTYGAPGQQNGVGLVVRIKDAAGQVDVKYDARGNVVERRRTVLGRTYVTGYACDSLGRTRCITYPDGFTVHYEYDSGGNLARVTDGQGRVVTQSTDYNAAGQLGALEFGNGVRSSFTYDNLLRMMSIRTVTATDQTLQGLDYAYDPGGNIMSITDSAFGASQTFTYDALGRLTRAVGPYGEETYAYDAIGNLLRKGSLTFTVDPDHPQRVISGQGAPREVLPGQGTENNPKVAASFRLAYDARGNAIQKGDRRFEYDSENRLARVRDKAGQVIEENVYDAGGQRVIVRTRESTTIFIDGIYEEGKTHAARHVRAGSLLVATIVTPRATVQLIQAAPTVSFGAHTDRNGLWTSVCIALAALGLALWLLRSGAWRSWLDSLVAVNAEFRRRPKTGTILLLLVVAIVQGPTLRADCRTGHIDGSVLALSYEPVLVTLLAGAPSVPGAESEKRYYYHSNHLGSVNVVTDEQGKVVERRDYKPYGDRFGWTGPQSGPRELLMTFDGQRYDDATGLHYFGARHYDAELGRFLTADTQVPDPMNPKTLHRYAFAGGNPIRYIDPTGHSWQGFLDFLTGFVVGVAVGLGLVLIVGAIIFTGGWALVGLMALGGAFLGAGGLGFWAATKGYTVADPQFWLSFAAGAVLGAAIGAGLAVLPSLLGLGSCVSLFGATTGLWGILQGAVVGALLGAMFGAVETTIVHFRNGGGPEGLLGKVALGVAFGAAIGGMGGALGKALSGIRMLGFQRYVVSALTKITRPLSTLGLGVSRLGYAIGTGQRLLPVTDIGGTNHPVALFGVVVGMQFLVWFLSSPQKPTGIPGWVFGGTWPGAGGSLGTSDEAALFQTMPLAP